MSRGAIKRVAVIGCGVMGSGICEVAARAGCEIVFVDVDEHHVARGWSKIRDSISEAVNRGKLSSEKAEEALARIHGTDTIQEAKDAEFIIEAVNEDRSLKCELFERLGDIASPEAVLASNTSSLSITSLGIASGRPDRVLGVHFFNPAPVMSLIELIEGARTSASTLARAQDFAHQLGKKTVMSKDRAGFIVNKLVIPFILNAIRSFEQGIATAEDLDRGVELGLGHPMGPLTLADFVGLDIVLAISEILFEEYRTLDYAPPPTLKRLVEAGYLGKKTGRGFFQYESDSAALT